MPDEPIVDPAHVPQKSLKYVICEGVLYFLIGSFTPAVAVLESDKELSERAIIALLLSSIVAGSVALKAFMSQSIPPNKA